MRRDEYDNSVQAIADSASPGFTFGKSGNVPNNTWLLNDTVPSNLAGRAIYLNNATLEAVFVRVEISTTFDLEIYEHDGTTYTLIYTFQIIATRADEIIIPIPPILTTGKELAAKIVNGSARNPVIGCQLRGTLSV